MSFVAYDLTFLFFFCLFLAIFLIIKKKNLKREGLLILYRTKVGLKLIDYFGKKHKNLLEKSQYIVIFFGYVLMAGIIYLLFQLVYLFIKIPELAGVIKIPPIVPLIPYLPEIFKADFLPPFYFTYWIIALAITAIVHEFFHGIYARAKGVKIKSTGFAFLGPFTAFFVEPNEKKVEKLKIKDQLSFIAAGSFSNLLLTILFLVILWLYFISFYAPAGAIFNTYTYNVLNASEIKIITNERMHIDSYPPLDLTKVIFGGKNYYINTKDAKNLTGFGLILAYEDTPALNAGLNGVIIQVDDNEIKQNADLEKELSMKKPGEIIKIKTLANGSIKEYEIELAERPDNEEKAYLGIAVFKQGENSFLGKIRNKLIFWKDPNTYYKEKYSTDFILFIYNLIWWIVLINISVALGNMLPVGIADGGRYFYLTMLKITSSKRAAKIAYKISTYLILAIFAFLTMKWFLSL
ncbi:site-2 protease family protein [Candidatus Pacearchaeota archaeon]|nr:site-2 protease family protein [Candidatus Pacearchaeota archaeon]